MDKKKFIALALVWVVIIGIFGCIHLYNEKKQQEAEAEAERIAYETYQENIKIAVSSVQQARKCVDEAYSTIGMVLTDTKVEKIEFLLKNAETSISTAKTSVQIAEKALSLRNLTNEFTKVTSTLTDIRNNYSYSAFQKCSIYTELDFQTNLKIRLMSLEVSLSDLEESIS